MADDTQRFKMYSLTPNLLLAGKDIPPPGFVRVLIDAAQTNRWWADAQGFRYSIVKAGSGLDGYLYGYITQQHTIERHLYSERKDESADTVESYEDRFFVLDMLHSILSLEWRRFRKQAPLSLPLTVRRLETILNDVAREAGLAMSLSLEEVYEETSKSEFLDIFRSHKVSQVIVDDFGSEIIPELVTLVNPTPGLEGALREIVAHDRLEASMDKFIAETKRRQGDLTRSAITRAAMYSGDPKLVGFISHDGHHKVRKKVQKSEVDIPNIPGDDGEVLDAAALASIVVEHVRSLDIKSGSIREVSVQLTLLEREDGSGE